MTPRPVVYSMVDLTKRYGELVANDRITFDIYAGEILGLLGPNGAGKTTLIRQILGLITPTSGRVTFCGRPLRGARAFLASQVGYTPQNPSALEDLTPVQALRLSGCLRGVPRARGEAEALILDFGLSDVRRLPIRHLSGGQRRLVGLAVALIGSPKVLVLDEPTAALDGESRRRIWQRVIDLNRSRGTTIIFVTHQVQELDGVVHRAAILRRGRLAGVGTPAEIKSASNRRFRIDFTLRAGRASAIETVSFPGLRRIGPERFTIPIDDDDPDSFVADVLRRLPSLRTKTFTSIAPAWRMRISNSEQTDDSGGPPRPALLRAFVELTRTQAASFRWAWKSLVISGVLLPCMALYGIRVLVGRQFSAEDAGYILTGNILISFFMPLISNTSSRLCFLHVTGALDFFRLAAVPRWLFLLATIFAFFCLSLPGMIAIAVLNVAYLHFPISIHPVLPFAVLAAAYAFGAIGVMIGLLAHSTEQTSALSHLTSALLVTLAPTIVPLSRLPRAVAITRYFVPTWYASRLLQSGCGVREFSLGTQLRDLAVLLGFGTVCLALAVRFLDREL